MACVVRDAAAATAFTRLPELQAVLSILPDAPANLLHIRNPVLPRGLQELTLTNLRVGKLRVSLHFARRASRTLVNVLAVESDAEPFQVRIEVG